MPAMLAVAGWIAAALLAASVYGPRRRLALVADAAHEIRGPATALALAGQMLRREPGGLRRALAVETQLDRLRCGLDDLDAARKGERASPRPAAVGLALAAHRAALAWRPAATASGRRLRFRWEGEAATARVDPARLQQALGNLLANALEHGSGPVELCGSREGGRARIEVRDGGGPPVRADAANVARGGRGLGLAIADRAAGAAGGSVALHRGAGATVAPIELPVVEE